MHCKQGRASRVVSLSVLLTDCRSALFPSLLCNSESTGILNHLKASDRKALRRILINAIVSTDMACRTDLVARAHKYISAMDSNGHRDSGAKAHDSFDDRLLLVSLALNAADHNIAILEPLHAQRVARYQRQEAEEQAELERGRGQPVTVLLAATPKSRAEQEISLISLVIRPVYVLLGQVAPELVSLTARVVRALGEPLGCFFGWFFTLWRAPGVCAMYVSLAAHSRSLTVTFSQDTTVAMWETVRQRAATHPDTSDHPLPPLHSTNGGAGGANGGGAGGNKASLAGSLSGMSMTAGTTAAGGDGASRPRTVVMPRNFKRTVSSGGTVRFEPTIDEEAKIRDYRDLWSAV